MVKKKQDKKTLGNRLSSWVQNNPFKVYLFVIVILLLLIISANFFRKTKESDLKNQNGGIKQVDVYDLSSEPEFTVLGKVRNGDVIDIISQTSGVITSINKTDGTRIRKGEKILSISNSYTGANSAVVQNEIAIKNNQLTNDNFDDQIRAIDLQRKITESSDSQSDDLRKIARESVDGTKEVLLLNESLLSDVRSKIQILESQNENGINDQLISQAKQSEASLVAAVNNLKNSVKQIEYQNADDSKPADLANLSRELSITQLDIQKRSVTIGRDISTLNTKLANVALSISMPMSPCDGTVNSIDITKYDFVSPGVKIATIVCDQTSSNITAYVSSDIAAVIDLHSKAQVNINNKSEEVVISYISNEVVNGSHHKVIFDVPKNSQKELSNDSYVELKIKGTNYIQDYSFVPVDSIYQTAESSSIMFLINADNTYKAESENVEILSLIDKYALVNLNKKADQKIILTRGIKNQENVSPRQIN